MKNLKKILILLILFIPVFVNADMSAPTLREFEIVVVNPDGVDYTPDSYYGGSGHLNKDEVVVVKSEYNGEYSIAKKDGDGYTIGTINSLDGFSIVQEVVDPTTTENDDSIVKYSSKKKAIVNNESGVNIYQGPSKIYKSLGIIKNETKLEYQYAINGESGITYIYTSQDGKQGWIEILNEDVLIENDSQFIFRNDVETQCGTIPKNAIQTPEYKTDNWSKKTQFEYNGCKVLLRTFRSEDILYINSGKDSWSNSFKTIKDVNIYENTDASSNLVATIPANTEVVILAEVDELTSDYNVQYVDYNGIRGWSIGKLTDSFESTGGESKIVNVEDTIKVNRDKATDEKKETTKVKKEKKNNSKILGLDSKQFVIVCTGAAVIISLTTIVIIVLVNKKKKNKVNSTNINNETPSKEVKADKNVTTEDNNNTGIEE